MNQLDSESTVLRDNDRRLGLTTTPPKTGTNDIIREAFRNATALTNIEETYGHWSGGDAATETNVDHEHSRNELDHEIRPTRDGAFDGADVRSCKTAATHVTTAGAELFCGFPSNAITGKQGCAKDTNRFDGSSNYDLRCSRSYLGVNQDALANASKGTSLPGLPQNIKLKWLQRPSYSHVGSFCRASVVPAKDFCPESNDRCSRMPLTRHNERCRSDLLYIPQPPIQNESWNREGSTENRKEEINAGNDGNVRKLTNICAVGTSENDGKAMSSRLEANNFSGDLLPSGNLQQCIRLFLKRAEEGVSVELPAFPKTRPLNPGSSRAIPNNSDRCKRAGQKVLTESLNPCFPYDHTERSLHPGKLEQQKEIGSSISRCSGKLTKPKRTEIGEDSRYRLAVRKNLTCARTARGDTPEVVEAQTTARLEADSTDDPDTKESYRYTCIRSESRPSNSAQEVGSIARLTAYKKRYYDALLDVQRTKVAVANSLAVPSVDSSVGYDQYVARCSYQRRKHQQQCVRNFVVNPQLAACTVGQPAGGLSNVYGTPLAWMRYGDWTCPSSRPFRHQQWIHSACRPASPFAQDQRCSWFARERDVAGESRARPCVKRRKLEEIVGKLREVDNNGFNN